MGRAIPIRLVTSPRLSVTGAVAATMGLALFLRLVHLGHLSFWSDEILSITRSQAGWSFQLHMLTYESILRLWMGLGESEAVVRMLSVLFGVAAVPAMYALGARLFGVRAGIIASLLLAVNAFHIQYSQEARGYSLLVLLVILSTLLFVRGVESRSPRVWAGYVLLSVLAVYSHGFGIFVLGAHAGSVPFLRRREVPWAHLAVSWAVIAGSLTPFWLSTGSGLIGGSVDTGGLSWIPATSAKQLSSVLTTLVVAATTWYSSRASWATWKYVLPLSGLFVPIFLALLISTVRPIVIPQVLHRLSPGADPGCILGNSSPLAADQPDQRGGSGDHRRSVGGYLGAGDDVLLQRLSERGLAGRCQPRGVSMADRRWNAVLRPVDAAQVRLLQLECGWAGCFNCPGQGARLVG